MTLRINARMFGFIPAPILYGLGSLAPIKRMIRAVLKDLGIPKDVFEFVNWLTRYDTAKRLRLSRAPALSCRRFASYAPRIWDYWGAQSRPGSVHRSKPRGPRPEPGGGRHRRFVGHRQGNGAQARLGGREGAAGRAERKSWLKPRRRSKRQAARRGSTPAMSRSLRPAMRWLPESSDHGTCDYLINNAGRLIRRGIINSFDRFHDFERTMQLNYFGALRLIMWAFCPK